MLDIKRIRSNPEALREAMRKRRNKGADVTELLALDEKRRELMQTGKMKSGVLTEDVQLGSPSTAAKVLIGNSVNGNIVWVDSNGYTLKQLLAEK